MNNIQSRRTFLKKIVYTAPIVVALGSLTLPTDANAHNHGSNISIGGQRPPEDGLRFLEES